MGTSFVDATSLESTGIIPRAVQQIFNTIDELKRKAKESHGIEPTFTVEAQFIELYNEELVDLLAGDRNSNVKISEDANTKEIVIKNARKMQTNVPEEVMNILKIGSDNRSTAETKMNQQSSRSHAIFSLYFQQSTLEVCFLYFIIM
jgi:kinesin family protein 4/21/27